MGNEVASIEASLELLAIEAARQTEAFLQQFEFLQSRPIIDSRAYLAGLVLARLIDDIENPLEHYGDGKRETIAEDCAAKAVAYADALLAALARPVAP